MNIFSKAIIDWYKENKRELPWRESSDPYLDFRNYSSADTRGARLRLFSTVYQAFS